VRVRWTEAAAHDFEVIADYLFDQSAEIAPVLIRRIFDAVNGLKQFPYRGRRGREPGTRELVISNLPYLVVYCVSSDMVLIGRVLHGAQQWPR
jgi:plasmid stabilization system protein ParE